MKKIALLIGITAFVGSTAAILKEDGRAGATGSPGETTCNTSQCHTGNPINASGGSITISGPTFYNPSQVYPINVTVSRFGSGKFGIGFEALRSTGANGGQLTITNSAQTQIKNASVGGNIRNNVVHKLNGGVSSNSHTFTFNWTAPSTNIGNITFYAAGNASNNSGTASGDFIYTASQVVSFATGINDNPSIQSLAVYPNPVTDRLQINFNMVEPGKVEVNLYNLQGKLSQQLASELLAGGDQEIKLDLQSDLPAGIYMVELVVDGKRNVKKVVKI